MSKFAYKAEGELNSQYLLDLLKEYLSKLLESNSTEGLVEDDYKVDTTKPIFIQKFKDTFARLFKGKDTLLNYNKVLTTKHIKAILNGIDIYLQTNVLSSKEIWDLKHTLKAVNFDRVLPLIDEYREKAIKVNEKKFLKVLDNVKFLRYANSNYILYNSPVTELKPFLSDKVSLHKVDYVELQTLVKYFVNLRYDELNNFNFEPTNVTFIAKAEDFYNENITDSGIGEDVEKFIRSKMLEKLEIAKHDEELPEVLNAQIAQIDLLLKRLKVAKIEKMLQKLIVLKTNLAHAKEIMDGCKDIINKSTIPNKAQIFLVMDDLYYKLSKQCEDLQQKTKLKLQLVDKQKMFTMLETLQDKETNNDKNSLENVLGKPTRNKKFNNSTKEAENLSKLESAQKPNITSNLYDDYDDGEIHVTEDDGNDDAEEEIIIVEDKN